MLPFFVLMISLLAAQSHAEKVFYALEDPEHHFEEFIVKFNKQYYNEEEKSLRFNIFKENLKKANEYNVKYEGAFGITNFSDLSEEEFLRDYTGLAGAGVGACSPAMFSGNLSAPDTYDWHDRGAVSEVKQQQTCGSCWAFSVTGNLEGQYATKHQNLIEFSEQQLVDCVTTCGGCDKGFMDAALAFLVQSGGVMRESDYPYQAVQSTCRFDQSKAVVKLSGCNSYQVSSEDQLKDILVNVGPLSIGIDASMLNQYNGDITDCGGSSRINHAVLLVGYGNDGGKPFWLIKNSWGPQWGVQGYLRLAMGVNACGILTSINSGVVE